ncbi:MAG: cytochrome c-type biogenesis protein CcmH [Myxococcota bacterium]
MPQRILIPALLFLALALCASPAGAEAEEGWSYGLWSDLMSPYCPGRTLADCPSENAEQLRGWIVAQEEGGRSQTEVEAELYETFGDVLRQTPAPTGIGLAAYAAPILLFLAGGALVVIFLRRQTASGAPSRSAPVAVVDPELQRELDEEIGSSGP